MAIAPAPAAGPAANGAPGTGVAIESAGKSVRVFYLPTANELSTSVVVWVDENRRKSDARNSSAETRQAVACERHHGMRAARLCPPGRRSASSVGPQGRRARHPRHHVRQAQCRPPRSARSPPLKYNCWKVLDRKQLALTQGTPSTMKLINGRTFQVAYNGLSPDKRYKVAASISAPDGNGFNSLAEIAAEPGRKFHVGGFRLPERLAPARDQHHSVERHRHFERSTEAFHRVFRPDDGFLVERELQCARTGRSQLMCRRRIGTARPG